MSSTQDQLDKDLQHIKSALQQCQFPDQALNQWHQKFINPNQPNNNNPNNTNPQDNINNKKNITIVVPYMSGTGEMFRKMCKRKGIQVHFKGTNTLRTMLGNPKDKDPKNNQTGIIYHYKCPQINCPSAHIGESGRSLSERVKEHFKAPSPPTYIVPPEDIQWILNSSALSTKRLTASPGPSWRSCLSRYRIQHSTGT